MIVKPLCLVTLSFFAVVNTAVAIFPEASSQLTLFDQDSLSYQATCPNLYVQPTPNTALTAPFQLLNWNIYKQQRQNWRTSLREWAISADIITLQEAKLSTNLRNFSAQNNLYFLHNYAFKYRGMIYGVNTLSKVKPQSFCGSLENEPWIIIPKAGLASTYILNNYDLPLLVINLHGVNFTFTAQPLKEQLSPYLALIKQHKGPIIFSGDFNTWSDARLERVEQALITLGFSEAQFNEDERLTAFGLPLDHIYFRGLKVIEAKSIATDSSDHSPQLVTFDLL
ncbi:EEP domain-containing protein [Psychromonas sp. psych-6C06]|nr:EEP domain-containing protein [Psychromonas sp. psych-6C06]